MGLVGSRLRALREARGYTQEELAKLVGVGYQQMWRWEQNKTEPSGDFIARLAQILNVSADYLLGLEDEPLPRLNEDDLTLDERRLVDAYRSGRIWEIIRLLGEQAPPQPDDQP